MSAELGQLPSDLVPPPKPCTGLRNAALVLSAIGAALSLTAAFNETHRVRLGFGYLWGFVFVWSAALGALFFVGLQHLVRAVWSVVVRRVAEMFAASIWLVALLFVPILFYCFSHGGASLFPWLDAEHVSHDALLQQKQPYLNLPFFAARAAAFFALWIGFAVFFTRNSLKQDVGRSNVESAVRMRKASAPFMLVFAITATFASFDWLMSLEPHWFSTIFGVYVFSGMVVTALALITITTIGLRSSGRLGSGVVGDGHLYNLGALMFAFVCFWAYIAFSQYMLIWYGNIPEESFYLVRRFEGGWLFVSLALGVVRFVVPFLALLSRSAKTNPTRLLWVSIFLLTGQLLDLYWLIMPQLHPDHPILGWQELGPVLMLVGILILFVSHFLERHLPVSVGDPLFEESLRFYI